ncbi:hypothetical protein ABT076_17215 [Streptomyces sp. NPDC002131]|uniref:hypothetical protein n=1 Tax=unclassified Streptomyces TaxID=2593676 RepID=UPI002256C4B1|nr:MULTISPECIES: hypothetical protein [unclassified Streptomyces]MCX5284491.1 hypothetical protein [Streptomyces sp. NBC_00198]WSD78632.1 hypothetical protein OHB33_21110 [Streptomyces sp. NBC_01558]
MTPWLRILPTAGLLAAALLCGTGPAANAAPPAAGILGQPGPGAPEPGRAIPTPDASGAGSLAGEGRVRPGRPDEDSPDPEDSDSDSGTDIGSDIGSGLSQVGDVPEARDDPAPVQQSVVSPGSTTEPVWQVLPLGGGLILVGLGLGLAFVGLRVRRG